MMMGAAAVVGNFLAENGSSARGRALTARPGPINRAGSVLDTRARFSKPTSKGCALAIDLLARGVEQRKPHVRTNFHLGALLLERGSIHLQAAYGNTPVTAVFARGERCRLPEFATRRNPAPS